MIAHSGRGTRTLIVWCDVDRTTHLVNALINARKWRKSQRIFRENPE